MAGSLKIIITGEHDDLDSRCPTHLSKDGRALEWVQLAVLRFERLPVDERLVERVVTRPFDWIVFTSQRAVRFWSEALMEKGIDFPLETQVACIGEQTAAVAGQDGFTPDFYPTEPGTEKFLEEFESLIVTNTARPTLLIPQAEAGRGAIGEKLEALGCPVTTVPIYRTMPRENLRNRANEEEVASAALILFTSPSSVDAFLTSFPLPPRAAIASIGRFTAEHLKARGVACPKILPGGDFQRIGEILC